MSEQQQDQEHEGWTANGQKQEPEPSRDAPVCQSSYLHGEIRMSHADRYNAPLCPESNTVVHWEGPMEWRQTMDTSLGEHHWRDGMTFKRLSCGCVRLAKWKQNEQGSWFRGDLTFIPSAEWDSIAGAVKSAMSETACRIAETAIRQRGPLVIWENENGLAYAWGRIPAEDETGDGGDFDSLTNLLSHLDVTVVDNA